MATNVADFYKANPTYTGQDPAAQQQAPQQQAAPAPTQQHRSWWQSLLPAVGSGLVTAGALALAPETGGLSLAALLAGAGGAVGGGAGEFAAQKLNHENTNFGNIAKQSAIGGAIGAGSTAFAGVRGLQAAKAAGAEGDAASQLATQVAKGGLKAKNVASVVNGETQGGSTLANGLLRQSTIAPKSTLGSYGEQQALTDVTSQFPQLRGSAFSKFKNVEPVINQLNDQVGKTLAKTGVSIDSGVITDRLQGALNSVTDPAEQKRLYGLLDKNITKVFPDGIPSQVNLTEINTLKKGINSEASAVFKKIAAGNPLTAGDNAILTAREELGNIITDHVPQNVASQVGKLNQQQSVLIKGVGEFKRLAEGGSSLGAAPSTLLGTSIPQPVQNGLARGGQAVADYAGRGLNTLGDVLGGAKTATLRQAIPRTFTGQVASQNPAYVAPQQTQNSGVLGASGQGGTTLQPQDLQTPQPQQQIQPQFSLADAMAASNADPKNAATYLAYAKESQAQADAQNKTTGASSQQQKAINGTQNALQTLNNLTAQFNQGGGGKGIIGGTIANEAAKFNKNPALKAYNQQKTDAALAIAVGLFGGTTGRSPQIIKQIMDGLPNANDSKDAATFKINNLRQRILSVYQDAINYGQIGSQTAPIYDPTQSNLAGAIQ